MSRAYGVLGERVSNNVAEYSGVYAVATHAASQQHQKICFQTDSMFVAKQLSCKWACRDSTVRPWLLHVTRALEHQGREVLVDHICREHNKEADALANRAVGERL